ncbi:MAG: glycerol-3-phosphate dehydrogenase/oxidase [Solirubrobacterales bacterium]|nr:glycerol-3-phosphate dehydrogenase/oxidase [Solirubrobacterales bacterium]
MLSRDQALKALTSQSFDVLVVGGGITGAGVALDAASRGYSVALVERNDYASGTSSRSSKLVHGGLRYLQSFDLGLVREALLERQVNVHMAPHLVKPLKMVVPAFEGEHPDRLVGVALNMYDGLALPTLRSARKRKDAADVESDPADWSPDRHREITGEEVVNLLPALKDRNPTGGYLFYDCQTDDVRLVLTALEEACRWGAVVANRVNVTGLVESGGRATGVTAEIAGGGEVKIKAAHVVNATGVWADRLRPGELRDEAEVPHIRPSRGTHILIDRELLPLNSGVIVPAGEGRSIFALPWLGRSLIGTTDNDYESESLENVPPSDTDVDYLLNAVNEFFKTDLGPGDVAGAFAGVRPLIAPAEGKKSVDISRKAELYETSSGMITITGGKLTTWRAMAEMTVDRIVAREGADAPCRTRETTLGRPINPEDLPRVEGVPDASYAALAGRYGKAAEGVLAVAAERGELAQPVVAGLDDILAEVVWAVREQQAATVGDVLLRRTRLALLAGREAADIDSGVAARVAEALGNELGWDEDRKALEVAAFIAEAEAEGVSVPAVPA